MNDQIVWNQRTYNDGTPVCTCGNCENQAPTTNQPLRPAGGGIDQFDWQEMFEREAGFRSEDLIVLNVHEIESGPAGGSLGPPPPPMFD